MPEDPKGSTKPLVQVEHPHKGLVIALLNAAINTLKHDGWSWRE
jgi:hypothetical protein